MAKTKRAEIEKRRDIAKARAYDALVQRNVAEQILQEAEQQVAQANQELEALDG